MTLADTASVWGKTLSLVGAGVRTKTFLKVKVYVAGLYMETPSKEANEVIGSDQAKRMVMHFVRKEVSREKIVDGWTEGFKKNSQESLPSLQGRIDTFNSYFEGSVKKGEEIVLTYLPGTGTEVSIRGEVKGTIEGRDFMEALFKIWFGQFPADTGLKESILK
ncbi:MAG: hypothetical protein GTO08_05305 [Deltaproteobacteria bacterium]|nr:hypothetical protein [Deltaproteobacteria bacterium]